jgi:hypothetical protein
MFVSEIGRPLPPLRAIKENQFEAGVRQPIAAGSASLGVTGYYRMRDDPPHPSLFPDSRFYTYASFNKGKAYGMEIKVDVPRIGSTGPSLSGHLKPEFWESAFTDKQLMWGRDPAKSAILAKDDFARVGLKDVLELATAETQSHSSNKGCQ